MLLKSLLHLSIVKEFYNGMNTIISDLWAILFKVDFPILKFYFVYILFNVLGQLAQYPKCDRISILFETVKRPSKCHSQLLVFTILSFKVFFVVYFSISLLKRHGWTNRCTRNWWFNGICIRRNDIFKCWIVFITIHSWKLLLDTKVHWQMGLIVSQQWSSEKNW